MTTQPNIDLPPGFEDMSRREQIEYVQKLWEYLAPTPEEVPVPEWQVEVAQRRLRSYDEDPSQTSSWEEVRDRLAAKHGSSHG